MRKTVLSLTIGMAAACALAMLTAAYADDNEERELGTVEDLKLEITEDISDPDFELTVPGKETPKTASPKADPAPVKELVIAQNPAPAGAPAAADAGNISNILAEPALDAPAAQAPVQVPDIPEIPDIPAPALTKTIAEPAIPQLPPVEKSIVKGSEAGETLPPAVTIDPTVETSVPYDPPVVQSVPGSKLIARGPAPILPSGGGCSQCARGGFGGFGEFGNGYGYVEPLRPVYYGVQRNGLPAYPRAGNCCGGCCGRRGPMEYPYYTLRGPRDFDDPNPRPIGP